MKENMLARGIQRGQNKQREKYHIKDISCISPVCNGKIRKNIEVRYCDYYPKVYEMAKAIRSEYYNNDFLE